MKRRVALLAVVLGACGYTLVGRTGITDPTIKRVGVPLFKDQTGKPGLDQQITGKVIEELQKRGGATVVQSSTGVDALILGEILSYQVKPVGFTDTPGLTRTTQEASRYEITLSAKVKYQKVGAPEPLYQSDAFVFKDEYDIGTQATYFDREDQAIERLSTNFAKSLVTTMLETF